ncbi:MAG: pyruvate dehydrogenase (acetyl-transferring) E1 component subunit alpha [Anaerolineae bacterium]
MPTAELVLSDSVFQVLTPEGQVIGPLPNLSPEQLLDFYRWMVYGRIFSDRMVALQRQGRIGTFGPLNGQEAASVGMAAPLKPDDWVIGSYREILAYLMKGVSTEAIIEVYKGYVSDGYARETHCLPIQIVLATQMLHAVGVAMAIKYEGKPDVVLAVCGDGATSEGDFNEALNFAGVFQAPVVFVIQNNGWAISVPRHKQTAARYIADRGPAFGMPGHVVDGNDVLAVYSIVNEAVERARAGGGPTLIEALTYRLGAHTTADDPKKYRTEEMLSEWAPRDPIARFKTYLAERGLLDESLDTHIHDEAEQRIQAAVDAVESLPPQDPLELFDVTFAARTPQQEREREALVAELGRKGE